MNVIVVGTGKLAKIYIEILIHKKILPTIVGRTSQRARETGFTGVNFWGEQEYMSKAFQPSIVIIASPDSCHFTHAKKGMCG